MAYVQLDKTGDNVIAVFAGPQDPVDHPDVIEISDKAPVLLAYYTAADLDLRRRMIRNEAERRIDTGILVNGKPFRCDAISILRMSLLTSTLEAAPENTLQTFRTSAGDLFQVTAHQAAEISAMQVHYTVIILEASANIQTSPPQVDQVMNDDLWPAKLEVTV